MPLADARPAQHIDYITYNQTHFRWTMHGSLTPGLCKLPNLTHFECSSFPGDKFDVDHDHFTALKSFTKTMTSERGVDFSSFEFNVPAARFGQLLVGDSFKLLRSFSIFQCHIKASPLPFGQLSKLTSVSFVGCRFDSESWLVLSFDRATQLQELAITGCALDTLPGSVCQLTNLQSLNMQDNCLAELPLEFANLTALTSLAWMVYRMHWST